MLRLSLEPSQGDGSIEGSQHVFCGNKNFVKLSLNHLCAVFLSVAQIFRIITIVQANFSS